MTAVLALGLLSLSLGNEPALADCGQLFQPAFVIDHELRGPVRSYQPQPGDIVLETDERLPWTLGHNLAKSGHPHHSKLVYQRPDGSLAILQAGSLPDFNDKINTHGLLENLRHEDAKTGRKEKRIWIRPRKCPLTPEQSARLTEFAAEVEGRRFARVRLLLLTTPWRAKGLVRSAFVGKVDYERRGYYCAELVTTALAYAGVLDADLVRPSAMYPHDLFMGKSLNPWVNRGLRTVNDEWEPPARWVSTAP